MLLDSPFVRELKLNMRKRRLSLRGLAALAGMSPSHLSRVLTEQRNPPSPIAVEKLAEVLEIPVTKLLILAGFVPERDKKVTRIFRTLGELSQAELDEAAASIEQIFERRKRRKGRTD